MSGPTRLVQLARGSERRVALVDEPLLRPLGTFTTAYALARAAIDGRTSLGALARADATGAPLDYDAVYDGASPWRLLVPFDHPDEPARCLVSGTGLTHLGSARDRDAMHASITSVPAEDDASSTDSMRMFRAGLAGGRPEPGAVGVAPEWFHKGCGTNLRAHGEALVVPPYAEDGGEEGEIAGAYLVASDGTPWRVGLCVGNEFSDHRFERRNYLNLAGSKLRTCALGPELVIDAPFDSVAGTVSIERGGATLWSKEIRTGEEEMSHSLRNLEHHHFKFAGHRRPGDVHVHYFGACALSFGDDVRLVDGDVMRVAFAGFGRALRNPLHVDAEPNVPVTVGALA